MKQGEYEIHANPARCPEPCVPGTNRCRAHQPEAMKRNAELCRARKLERKARA
jgi:hypothetical protein